MISKDLNELYKLVYKEIISIYKKHSFKVANFKTESESASYHACQFQLNSSNIIYRKAKITPKKTGQFVTFWKRRPNESIQPFNEDDTFDFFITNVTAKNKSGQFIIPKSILSKKGIITSKTKEGKRGFRVYPPWNITNSKQATNTQKWQLNHFYNTNNLNDLDRIKALFKN